MYRYLSALLLSFFLIVTHSALAQMDSGKFGFDGPITSITKSGNKVYVGGNFSNVGYLTGSGTTFSTNNGQHFLSFPIVDGYINVSSPDGKGGWFIGGKFTKVGDSLRSNLAHVNADGSIANWHPDPNGEVKCLKVSGDTVYFGGSFYQLGIKPVLYAIVDKNSASILPYLPKSDYLSAELSDGENGWYLGGMTTLGDSPVGGLAHIDSMGNISKCDLDFGAQNIRCMELDGNTLFVGGGFDHIYQPGTRNIARVSITSGLLNKIEPKVNGVINCVAPDGKGGIYIGGSFSKAGDSLRRNFAQIDSSGVVTSLDIQVDSSISNFKVHDSTLFFCGKFFAVNDKSRFFVASLNMHTGKVTGFNANLASGWVNDIEVIGDTIFIGGLFSPASGGQTGIASFNSISGKNNSLSFYTNGEVNTLCLYNGKLYMGGSFSSTYPSSNSYLAAMDITTELPTAWDPSVNGSIKKIVATGANMYINGGFSSAGGVSHYNLIQTDTSKGKVSSWAPNVSSGTYAMFVAGDSLYIGGPAFLASYNAGTGVQTYWNPGGGGYIYCLYSDGKNIFIGGNISAAGGIPQQYLAAIDTRTWKLKPWNPNPNSGIGFMHKSGNLLYVAGGFDSIGGASRSYIAALDTGTAKATSWNPDPNGYVFDFAIGKNTIFTSGQFTSIGGQSYSYIAAIDSATGSANSWNPQPNGQVESLALSGSKLFIGGAFTKLGSQSIGYLAEVDTGTAKVANWLPAAGNEVTSMIIYDSSLYVSGSFSSMGGAYKNNVAAVSINTARATSWDARGGIGTMVKGNSRIFFSGNVFDPSRNNFAVISGTTGKLLCPDLGFDGEVDAIEISGNHVYIGGQFLRTTPYVRHYLAALDMPSLSISSINPVPDGEVSSIASYGSNVFIGGSFSYIGSTSIPYIAQLNAANGKLTGWSSKTSYVDGGPSLFVKDTTLYIGSIGEMDFGTSTTRYGLAAISTNTGILRPFDAKLNGQVKCVGFMGKTLYIGGAFGSVGSTTRGGFAAIDSGTGTLESFNPLLNNGVNTISIYSDTIFAGGGFTMLNAQYRPGIAQIDADSLKITSWTTPYFGNGYVKALAVNGKGDSLFVGGNFSFDYKSSTHKNLATVLTSDASVYQFNQTLDSQVISLATKNNYLFASGNFTNPAKKGFGGYSPFGFTSEILNWSPNLAGKQKIKSIAANSKYFFAAGTFTKISGTGVAYMEGYSYPNVSESYMNAGLSDSVDLLLANDSSVYCFGSFLMAKGGFPRNYSAAFNTLNGDLRPWYANTNGYITSAAFSDQNIYISGYFDNVWSQPRYRVAALDTVTGKPNGWVSPVNLHTPLTGMTIVGNKLFGVEGQNVVVLGICSAAKLQLSGSGACSGSDGKITIDSSFAGAKYSVYASNKTLLDTVTGNGGNISITIPSTYLSGSKNTFTISALGTTCGNQSVQDTVSVFVKTITNNFRLIGSTTCSGNASVSITQSQTDITYFAFVEGTKVDSATAKDTTGVTISIPSKYLAAGNNYIEISATNGSCGYVQFPDSVLVKSVNALNQDNVVIGDTVCSGSSAKITIINVDPGVNYQVGSTGVSGQSDTIGNLTLTLPFSALKPGLDSFSIVESNTGCGSSVVENNKAYVLVKSHSTGLSFKASTDICGNNNGYIYLNSTLSGSAYNISISGKQIGSSQSGNGGSINFVVPNSDLKLDSNKIIITEKTSVCNSVVQDSAYIVRMANCGLDDAGLEAIVSPGSSICPANKSVTVKLENTGVHNLKSVKIGWTINSNLQTAYSWTGTLKQDSNVTVTIGTHNFISGHDTIRAWTYLPNTVTDSNSHNDSTELETIVNPLPGAKVSSNTTVCDGNFISLGDSDVSGDSYNWTSKPSGFTSIAYNPKTNPNASTKYYLTETNSSGCSKTDSVTIKVNPAPAAKVIQDEAVCKGISVPIGDTSVPDDTYSWTSVPAGFTSSASNPDVMPTVCTLYFLTESNTFGCEKTDSVLISVHSLPTANAGPAKTICEGARVSIGDTSVSGVTYKWTSEPPGFSSNVSNPTVSPDSLKLAHPKTFEFFVTASNGLGCSKTDSVSVTVNPSPSANVAPDIAICAGISLSIGDTDVSGDTYSWTSNRTGFSSTLANPRVAPLSSVTYILTESNNSGCSKTDSIVVTVNPLPVTKVSPNETICAGTSISIGDTAVTGNSYRWASNPSGFASSVSNPSVMPSFSIIYRLLQTNSFGCSKADSLTITVNPLPIAKVGQNKTICAGSTVSIGDSSVMGNTYSWISDPIGFTSSVSNPVVTPASNTTYKLTETNNAGCSKTDSVTISISPSPSANAGTASTICSGQSISIGSAAVSGDKYSWTSNPSGFTSAKPNPSVSPKYTTTYSVTETNTDNCSASDSVSITVNPSPDAFWTASISKCEVTFLPKSSSNKSYLWHFGDGDSSLAYGPVYDYAAKGSYKVSLVATAQNLCTTENDSIIAITELCTNGINAAESQVLNLSVYPNPFHSVLTVQYNLVSPSMVSVDLFDINGKRISVLQSEQEAEGQYQLDINADKYHLNPGVYLLKFMVNGSVEGRHIVKF